MSETKLVIATMENYEKFKERAGRINTLRGVELAQEMANLSGEQADALLLGTVAQRRIIKLAEEGDQEALEVIQAERKKAEKEAGEMLALLVAPTDGKAH